MCLTIKKPIASLLFGLSAALLLVFALLPAHAVSVLVQQNNAGCFGCSSSLSVSFKNGVAYGDVIVVGVSVGDASFILSSLTDSLGSNFTLAVASSGTLPPIVYIYYATLSGSGSDVITATFSAAAPAETIYIYEVSGVTATRTATSSGSGTGTSIATKSAVVFEPGAFLLGVIGTNGFGGTITLAPGFSLSTNNFSGEIAFAQYSMSGVASPTNLPAMSNAPVTWAEDAIALMPS